MSTKLAENVIQPTGLPQYCSACHGQDSNLRHIDFDAAVDRGWYGNDPGTHITQDDLILCETCLGSGARQLGFAPKGETQDRMTSLEHRLAEETKRADKAESYAERMEDAIKHRPNQLHVSPPRKRGRPAKVGQED